MDAVNWSDQLRDRAKKTGSLVCLGLDPQLEKIPFKAMNNGEMLFEFCAKIMDTAAERGASPNVIKPNYAFFAQYGFEGLRALKKTIDRAHELGLPVILDAKRGDIGSTAEAYARECFEFWNADAVTVNPWMGTDAVEPFLKFAREREKGVYVLVRTSNAGAADFQGLELENKKKVFEAVADRLVKWATGGHQNIGAVVGATSMDELHAVCTQFTKTGLEIPLLIPGVGAQGAHATDVLATLRKTQYPLELAVINASRSVLFAFEKNPSRPFDAAAADELEKLRADTRIENG